VSFGFDFTCDTCYVQSSIGSIDLIRTAFTQSNGNKNILLQLVLQDSRDACGNRELELASFGLWRLLVNVYSHIPSLLDVCDSG
jgi:hypothetical protein